MRTWIKSPLAIFTNQDVHAENGIVVEADTIVELIPTGSEPGFPIDEIFDASEHVVIPGLINTHHHYYQTLTRAVPCALNKALFPWLNSLYPIWAGLTDEMVHVSTQLATAELMLSGCTTSADHHYLFTENSTHATDAQVNAVNEVGIRAIISRGSMSVGKNNGGLPPENTVQDEDVILADCERVIQTYHGPNPGSMLQITLAPCSPFSVSIELMIKVASLARTHNIKLHTHLAETQDETKYCLEKFNCRPLDYLKMVNWLDNDVWLAHGIYFNEDEIRQLGNAGVGITHCPSSNMLLGSGQCQVLALQENGCAVGIGVDGSASNDSSNMMQEVRQALLLQRLQYGAANVSHEDVLSMATQGSAQCLGRDDIGSIAVGKQADIALFKLDEPRFSGAGDPLAALVLSGAISADFVMVNGSWTVKNHKILGLDIESLQSRHQALALTLQRSMAS